MGQKNLRKVDSQDNLRLKAQFNFTELFKRTDEVVVQGSSPLRNVGTGTPNTNSSLDAYRTGKMGLGESDPEELFDMVGTPATGSYKTEYTYANGRVVRVQEGGQNILSELGAPSGSVEGYVVDMVNIPEPEEDDSVTDWIAKYQVKNAADDVVDFSIRTKGVGAGFENEAQAKLVVSNDTDSSNVIQTPHQFVYNKMFKLNNYSTYIEGYTHNGVLLGAPAFTLALDNNMNLIAVPV